MGKSHREGEVTVFLGADSSLEGHLCFQGQARLEGRFQGSIEGAGTLMVGPQAHVQARITVSRVVISGEVVGDINASERIEMRSPGRLKGDISAPLVVMDEGVLFEGHCTMTGQVQAQADSKITLLTAKS